VFASFDSDASQRTGESKSRTAESSQVARNGVLPLYFKIANRRSCILQDYRIAQINRMLKGDGRRRNRNATILRACLVQYRQYVHRVRPSPDGGKSAAA
jgi:hypothetical protein